MVISIDGGTPSHHPFLDGIFPYQPTIFGGTPILGNLHINLQTFRVKKQHLDTCPSPAGVALNARSFGMASLHNSSPTGSGGFHSYGGTPKYIKIYGLEGNILLKFGWWLRVPHGTPISGNLHVPWMKDPNKVPGGWATHKICSAWPSSWGWKEHVVETTASWVSCKHDSQSFWGTSQVGPGWKQVVQQRTIVHKTETKKWLIPPIHHLFPTRPQAWLCLLNSPFADFVDGCVLICWWFIWNPRFLDIDVVVEPPFLGRPKLNDFHVPSPDSDPWIFGHAVQLNQYSAGHLAGSTRVQGQKLLSDLKSLLSTLKKGLHALFYWGILWCGARRTLSGKCLWMLLFLFFRFGLTMAWQIAVMRGVQDFLIPDDLILIPSKWNDVVLPGPSTDP